MSIRITDNMTKSLVKIQQDIAKVPRAAYDYWRSITPKRSGNARRRTKLNNNTIQAQYPYAQALDGGASKQAPDGMSKPTSDFLTKAYRKAIRK